MSIPINPSEAGLSSSQPTSLRRLLREVVETILLTALIYWAMNAATGRFRVESTSMLPKM